MSRKSLESEFLDNIFTEYFREYFCLVFNYLRTWEMKACYKESQLWSNTKKSEETWKSDKRKECSLFYACVLGIGITIQSYFE